MRDASLGWPAVLPQDLVHLVVDNYLSRRDGRALATADRGSFVAVSGSSLALLVTYVSRQKELARLCLLIRGTALLLPALWLALGAWRTADECRLLPEDSSGREFLPVARTLACVATCCTLVQLKRSWSGDTVVRSRLAATIRTAPASWVCSVFDWSWYTVALASVLLAGYAAVSMLGQGLWWPSTQWAQTTSVAGLILLWQAAVGKTSWESLGQLWFAVPSSVFLVVAHSEEMQWRCMVLSYMVLFGVHSSRPKSEAKLCAFGVCVLVTMSAFLATDLRWRMVDSREGRVAWAAPCNGHRPSVLATGSLVFALPGTCAALNADTTEWLVLENRLHCDLVRASAVHRHVSGLVVVHDRSTGDSGKCSLELWQARSIQVPVMYVRQESLEARFRNFTWAGAEAPKVGELRSYGCAVGNAAAFSLGLLSALGG